MRKLLLLLILMIGINCYSQENNNYKYYDQYINIDKYELVDSLLLEKTYIYSQFDYNDAQAIAIGDNEYIIDLPYKDNFVIRTTLDKTKAIVIYNSYCYGRHKEFTIKDSERKLILVYEDENMICGYVYDKYFKVCRYYEMR